MKPITVIICCIFCLMAYLSFIFPVSIFAENDEELSCEESRIIGEKVAEEEHYIGEFMEKGIFSGIFLPVLGPLILTAVVTNIYPQPSYVPNKETINEICYIDGYSNAARKKNVNRAFVGGLIGSAITGTIIFTVYVCIFVKELSEAEGMMP